MKFFLKSLLKETKIPEQFKNGIVHVSKTPNSSKRIKNYIFMQILHNPGIV